MNEDDHSGAQKRPLKVECLLDGYRLLGRLSKVLALLNLPAWVAWYSVRPLEKRKKSHYGS